MQNYEYQSAKDFSFWSYIWATKNWRLKAKKKKGETCIGISFS